ncbi:hypothetical protein QNI19_14685 [Cytophagaceae bacterium DM2B3-1]|uniref:Uncharacterized protein n=1 Tax=Xanthocytophaga flava TaxID=3048013 RepID=A0ABT7CKF4_9BACT|nr:hypothetical protein [Xanthocytophaga flavus]MDJ1494187.1 hypothetical protein [Xanthocytophaga flavus]
MGRQVYVNGYEITYEWGKNSSFENHLWVEIHQTLNYILSAYDDRGFYPTKIAVENAVKTIQESRKQFNYLAKVKAIPAEKGKVWRVEVWRNLQNLALKGEKCVEKESLWLTIINLEAREKAFKEAMSQLRDMIEYTKEVDNG